MGHDISGHSGVHGAHRVPQASRCAARSTTLGGAPMEQPVLCSDTISLWICGTGRWLFQTFRKRRVIVDTGRINLVLGKTFYPCKERSLELSMGKPGSLQPGSM